MIALPLLACLGVAVWVDDRFYIVALALLFLVVPLVMAMFYIYYMLTPEARRAALPRRITVTPGDGIKIHYHNATDEKLRLPPDEIIPWGEVKRIIRRQRDTVYVLRTGRLSFVIVENN